MSMKILSLPGQGQVQKVQKVQKKQKATGREFF